MTINWQAAKNFIAEKTDTAQNAVVEVFHNAKDPLSEIAVNANTEIDPVKNPVVNTLQQKTSQVVDSLAAASEQAKNTVLQAGKTIKDSVGDSLQKAESLGQGAVETVQAAINNQSQDWLNHHPIIHWLVSNPVPSLILLVIFIVLMFGLFQAMGSLIKDAWLLILTSPFKLFRASLQWSFQSLFKARNLTQTSLSFQPKILSLSPVAPGSVSIEYQERLTRIYQRLDEIHQEEHQLLEELKTIVVKP